MEPVEGTITGEVPNGAQVVLLWPETGALGRVGGTGDANGGRFELSAHPPNNGHTHVEFGTLVLFDGEVDQGETLPLDRIDDIVGAAPRHFMADCGLDAQQVGATEQLLDGLALSRSKAVEAEPLAQHVVDVHPSLPVDRISRRPPGTARPPERAGPTRTGT